MPRAQLAMAFAESTVDWATEELELTLEEVGQALGVNRRTNASARWARPRVTICRATQRQK